MKVLTVTQVESVVASLNEDHERLVEERMEEPYPSTSYDFPWSFTTNGDFFWIEFFGDRLWEGREDDELDVDELRANASDHARYAQVWAQEVPE